MVSKKLLISGIVQGVSFRFHAHEMATKLALKGWVRNLEDGRVELVVSGPDKAVEKLIQWARTGPPQAEVDDVDISDFKQETLEEPFFIRRDGGR